MEETKIHSTPSRAWLDIDLAALRRNAAAMRRRAGVPLIPMVKADAYGLGAAAVVCALEIDEPWGYGVATVVEGTELRSIGVTRPIIIFTPILADDFDAARKSDLTPTLSAPEDIRRWISGAGSGARQRYHLAIDTGMNRAGWPWRTAAALREVVAEHPPEAAYTHLHSSELGDGSEAVQEERFRSALDAIGTPIPFLHVDSSAAIARRCGAGGWSAVRPGVALYGVGSGAAFEPEPVVTLSARVVDLRWIEAGDTVSYDATYTAPRRERIATVSAGYADGYPRSLSNRGSAIIGGRHVPLRGLVTMDMTMFDVSDVSCEIGDTVTLIGGNGVVRATVESVAADASMSPYELLTGLSRRVERHYHSGETTNDQDSMKR